MPTTDQPGARASVTPQEFFDRLCAEPQPLLANVKGAVRFDVAVGDDVECWYIAVTKGDVEVSREPAPADAVVRVDKALFHELVSGSANATAAMLRGELGLEGNIEVVFALQRCFGGLLNGERS